MLNVRNTTGTPQNRRAIWFWLAGTVILTVATYGYWLFHPAYPNLPYQKLTRYGCNQSVEPLDIQEESYEVVFSLDGNTVELSYKNQRETLHLVEAEIESSHGLMWRGAHFTYFDNAEHHLYGPNDFALTPSCG